MDDLPTRWEVELEFVQSLANIQYLNHLAQNNYLSNPEFLKYLDYLQYWTQPEYSKYLVYPNCLHILTLLKSEEFRKSIVNPEFMNLLMNDMVKRWQDQDQSIFENPQSETAGANAAVTNAADSANVGDSVMATTAAASMNGDSINGGSEINRNGNIAPLGASDASPMNVDT